jgi:hypothetical protein
MTDGTVNDGTESSDIRGLILAGSKANQRAHELVLLILACILFAGSARANNGFTYITTCACKTTAQFNAAAASASQGQFAQGTYQLVSSTQAMTALIKVTGYTAQYSNGYGGWVTVFIPQTEVPIDATGALLSTSAPTESAQESFYLSYDQVLFGANRKAPTGVNEPDNYAASFIGAEEGEIVPGIGYALILMGVNQSSIQPGTVITVTFSDGTTAEYVKAPATATYQWTWNGVAHNKKGQRIDRAGNVLGNANTAGSGAGYVAISESGVNNTNWQWTFSGGALCTVIASVTVFDIGSGGNTSAGIFVEPC